MKNLILLIILLITINCGSKDPAKTQDLLMAAASGNVEKMQTLLNENADVNGKDEVAGWTSLWYASTNGNVEAVEFLLKNGADVDAQIKDGQTALMVAADKGRTKVVELLIAAKADVNMKNNAGKSALDFAGTNPTADLLKEAGAK
ncbi:MAG: ankyrin repeat domain-containing protein [Leptospira sp.]|nr:ankyrin repeat domain-containing protein [Leptospira sp.]